MTYVACVIQPELIVVGSDTRANFFQDLSDGTGKVVGKRIQYYWDGNSKIFTIIDNSIFIACQGLLVWGDERYTLLKIIRDFEEHCQKHEYETTKNVAYAIHKYFIKMKRDGSSPNETMHFIIGGFDNDICKAYYVNTHYSHKDGIQEIPISEDQAIYINGDGKGISIPFMPENEMIEYIEKEILERHEQTPFDVGDKIDVLKLFPESSHWYSKYEIGTECKNYNELMTALDNNEIPKEFDGCPADLMLS